MTDKRKKNFSHLFLNYGFYIIFLLVFVVFSIANPEKFLNLKNVRNILIQAMPIVILSTGLTMAIIAGGLDISVGSIAFITASLSVVLIHNGIADILPAFGIGVLAGVCVGIINGFSITILRVNPLITTLALMFFFRGLGQYVINNSQIMIHNDRIYEFGAGMVGPLPSAIFWGGLIIIVGQFTLSKSAFGRYLFAIGSNEKGAQVSVINVNRIKFYTYVISGFTASIGGLMLFSRSGAVAPSLGLGAEFTAVTVVVLGGTSMAGGKGSIFPGTFFGALTLVMLENGLVISGASPYFYTVAQGLVMLLAMYADALRTRHGKFLGRRIRAVEAD